MVCDHFFRDGEPRPTYPIGLPWTEEAPPLPVTIPDRQDWPKFRIATPGYSPGQSIEATIRFAFLKGVPDQGRIGCDWNVCDSK